VRLAGFFPALFCGVFFAACKPNGLSSTEKFADAYVAAHPDRCGDLKTVAPHIHYTTGGTKGAPKVLFVHGSPGSWKAFARFLDDPALAGRAFLISVDRPGYGGSGPGTPEPSLAAQAQALSAALELDDPAQPVILVGHSYGGPVVVKMAARGDRRIRGVVIVAGSVDPAQEHKKWIQFFADLRVVRWFVPRDLDVCNREIEGLKEELTDMLPDWARIGAHVTVLQGLQDSLVPPANAQFIEHMLAGKDLEVRRIPDQNHFIPWTRPDLIRDAIIEDLDALGKPR
jgi:pimeloyl-ACP methyl ester carboxylesterase